MEWNGNKTNKSQYNYYRHAYYSSEYTREYTYEDNYVKELAIESDSTGLFLFRLG